MVLWFFFQFLILNLIKEIKVGLSNCYKMALLPVYTVMKSNYVHSLNNFVVLIFYSSISIFCTVNSACKHVNICIIDFYFWYSTTFYCLKLTSYTKVYWIWDALRLSRYSYGLRWLLGKLYFSTISLLLLNFWVLFFNNTDWQMLTFLPVLCVCVLRGPLLLGFCKISIADERVK